MHILVTGGGGFLGEAIIKGLLKKNYTVRSIGRKEAKHLKPYGVEILCGDLSDPQIAKNALRGVDAVIHTAAKAGIWGEKEDFYKSNVLATENLLREAQKAQLQYFVYTSTPSVVIGKDDIHHGDERLLHASPFLCHYAATKALAERAVLRAASPHFRTLALRPHLIWGEKDPHLVPTLLNKATQGRLIQVGKGHNRVDLSHVDNAAWAHILALEALQVGKGIGKAYFVSDDAPVVLWDWIAKLLEALSLAPVSKTLSFHQAYALGYVLEKLYAPFQASPPLTRFLAIQLGKSHYFNIQAIKEDLGYHPIQDPSQALKSYIGSLRDTLRK
jgi:2-alkyl-3-oxoalkanoate reductase